MTSYIYVCPFIDVIFSMRFYNLTYVHKQFRTTILRLSSEQQITAKMYGQKN